MIVFCVHDTSQPESAVEVFSTYKKAANYIKLEYRLTKNQIKTLDQGEIDGYCVIEPDDYSLCIISQHLVD